jgi:tetratricopeptide (TPR) repeat protein
MNKTLGTILLILLAVFGWLGQSVADELEEDLRQQIDERAEKILADENNAGLHFFQGNDYYQLARHLKQRGSWILQTNKKILDSKLGDTLFEKSLYHWKETVKIQPNHAGAHFNLGVNYFIKGKKVSAVYHMKRADQIFAETGDTRGLEKSKNTLMQWYEEFGYRPELFETAHR